MAGPQYVFVMKGLSKTFPGGRQILKDIWLSFLPGAKIGVIGVNGSGKSTLLKLMAGIDKEFTGEAWAADGVRVGYLRKEPELDPQLNVLGNVMEGVAEKKALVDRYNEIAANYSDETAEEMAQLQDKIDAQNLLGPRLQVEQAMDALRCPIRSRREQSFGRREAAVSPFASCLLEAPDMLLLDEPTNHLDAESGRVAGTPPARLRRYRSFSSRMTAISSTTLRDGFSSSIAGAVFRMRQLLDLARHPGKRLSHETEQERHGCARSLAKARGSRRARARDRRKSKGAHPRPMKSCWRSRKTRAQGTRRKSSSPPGRGSGSVVVEAEQCSARPTGDRPAVRESRFQAAAGGIVGVIGPNWRGQDDVCSAFSPDRSRPIRRRARRRDRGDGLCRSSHVTV
jgi:ATPase subunit of ABC transporter with duplicated ATPase domains